MIIEFIMKQVFFVSIIILGLLINGCAGPNIKYNLGSERLSNLTDKIMEIEKIQCTNINGKKIFTLFNVDQQSAEYYEEMDVRTGILKKTSYDGNIENDFKRKFDELLVKQCKAIIVNNEKESDYKIKGRITKYYTQVTDYKKEGDPQVAMFGSTKMNYKVKIATLLKLNTVINENNAWEYDHLLTYNKSSEFIMDAAFYGLGGKRDVVIKDTMTLDYDNSNTIASGAFVNSSSQTQIWIFIIPSAEIYGHLDLYDQNTMKTKQRIDFVTEDFDLNWTGQLNNDTKKEYNETYVMPSGHLKILFYDYFQKLVANL